MRKLVLLLALACSKPPETPPPAAPEGPDWSKAFSHQVKWDAAQKAIVVDVAIAPGFHAYTVGETTGKPMLLQVQADGPWTLGEVKYPEGLTKDLPVGRSVIVEGKATIVGPLAPKAEPAAKIDGSFRYQVCTDQACDRPRTAAFSLDAT